MGYGPPVQVPMSLGTPRGVRGPLNPGLPDVDDLPHTDSTLRVAKPPMVVADTTEFSTAREADAARFAAEMGTAFSYAKAQQKSGKMRAKATESRKSNIAERRGKYDAATARKYGAARRMAKNRLSLGEARRLGLGPALYKTAKL